MTANQFYFQQSRHVQPSILKKIDIYSFTVEVIRSADRARLKELPAEARAAAAEIGYKRITDPFLRAETEPRFMELFLGMGGRV